MGNSTRRNFLRSAGAAAAMPAAAASPEAEIRRSDYRHTGFAPASAPRKLTDNLFVFEDTCNVYIVRNGASCVLIDFGSG